jgi:hypothetical protein
MTTILALDPGTDKSLAWLYGPGTVPADFTTVHTDPADLRKLLEAEPALPERLSLSTRERLQVRIRRG